MNISIIICTYNRAKILAETLESYAILKRPIDSELELLIIDNNSKDETQQIVEKFAEQHPEVHYIYEPEPGLSHARNTGIEQSRGDIIAYIDDDVYLDPNWLTEVLNIFQEYPDASCMGGKSIPKFESGKPEWIDDDLLRFYGFTNSGDAIKWMIYPEYPYGLNMAFRRHTFDIVGKFEITLGRKKKNLLSNEEKEIFWRINKAKLKVIYTPNALLYHRIFDERASENWVISRSFWQGVSLVAFDQLIAPKSKLSLLRETIIESRNLFRQASGNYWSFRKAYWHYKAIKFPEKCTLAVQLGKIKQMFIETLTF